MQELDYNELELVARRAGKNLEAVHFDPVRGIAMIKTSQDYYAMGQQCRRIVRLYFQTSSLDLSLLRSFEEVVLETQSHVRGLIRREVQRIAVTCPEG